MCREPMQLRRPGMSSPDRREIARIHTGGVCDPQYSEAPALDAFFRLVGLGGNGGRVEINDKALLCGGTYQLAAPWRLSISGVTRSSVGLVAVIILVNRQLP
jgi:hypothetical protein